MLHIGPQVVYYFLSSPHSMGDGAACGSGRLLFSPPKSDLCLFVIASVVDGGVWTVRSAVLDFLSSRLHRPPVDRLIKPSNRRLGRSGETTQPISLLSMLLRIDLHLKMAVVEESDWWETSGYRLSLRCLALSWIPPSDRTHRSIFSW